MQGNDYMCWILPRLVTSTVNKKMMHFCGKNMLWQHLLHHQMSLPLHSRTKQGYWTSWCSLVQGESNVNWDVEYLMSETIQHTGARCTVHLNVTSKMLSNLFSKYSYWIRILMWGSRGPVRLICGYARFAKISHFRAPAAESRGPASDTQPNFALRVAFVSC